MSLYEDLAADVLELIEELGQPMLLEKPGQTFTPGTGAVSGAPVTYACRGAVDNRSQQQGRYGQQNIKITGTTDGATVRAITVHVAAQGLGAVPLVGWVLYLAATADASKRYVIARVDEVSPAGTPVLYTLELSR